MATQNIIQYLETSQYNALPTGGTLPVGVSAMNRRQVETYIASAAIAIGELVALDFAKTGDGDKMIFVKLADTDVATAKCAIGFALTAAALGETVDVCIAGICEGKIANGVAQGDSLVIDAAAGIAAAYDAADVYPVIGYATEANSSGAAALRTVVVVKQM
jgi:hypothetical protein